MATATTTFIPNVNVVISYGLIDSCCFTMLQECSTRFVMCLEERYACLPSVTNLQNISGKMECLHYLPVSHVMFLVVITDKHTLDTHQIS
jgi:hypothetical protein